MDAKSRANFINSVATGNKVPCPKCNALNDAESGFCVFCGTKLSGGSAPEAPVKPVEKKEKKAAAAKPAAQPFPQVSSKPPVREKSAVKEQPAKKAPKVAFEFAEPEPEPIAEEESVFAKGLPEWDIVPPQVMVRRKK